MGTEALRVDALADREAGDVPLHLPVPVQDLHLAQEGLRRNGCQPNVPVFIDFVLIERTPDVRNGDIVVALVKGSDTTLKRFYREPDGVARLQPANVEMTPIFVPMEDLQIQGRLLAVLRKYK